MLILLVVLLLFGSKKIPELARGLGKGIREFKDATQSIQREIEKGIEDTDKKADDKPKPKPQPEPKELEKPEGSVSRQDDDAEPAEQQEIEPNEKKEESSDKS